MVKNVEELKQLLTDDEYDFQYDIGVAKPMSALQFTDHDTIVQSSALHYSVLCVKAELDQLTSGLRTLGVLDLVQANPKMLTPLFVYTESPPLTAGQMIDLFYPKLSPVGANRRDEEEAVVMLWVNYIQTLEGNRILCHLIISSVGDRTGFCCSCIHSATEMDFIGNKLYDIQSIMVHSMSIESFRRAIYRL